ncbi:hypothetical protein CC86DRAFT_410149 [Ophiobolus disseminans]|uniref:Uncharacterized protein n=1 Tax=Ophiobolus disseminans TaxID=1469910 RepID=A0A6A6ZN70_9PLEO|nr:hypothetical protein CC86DRAFT_410149 [Ophiobolus disseminans]
MLSTSSKDVLPSYVSPQDNAQPYNAVDLPLDDDDSDGQQSPKEQEHQPLQEPLDDNTRGNYREHWSFKSARRGLSAARAEAASPRRRHWNMLFTTCLAAFQLCCITTVRSYDLCGHITMTDRLYATIRHDFSKSMWANSAASRIEACTSFVEFVPSFLHASERPSTPAFVVAGLGWAGGVVSMHYINRQNISQKPSVVIGLMLGLFLSLPSLVDSESHFLLASSVSFVVALLMFCSALGHWYLEKGEEERDVEANYALI